MGFSLTTEKLRKLHKHDFELFCRALLQADYKARFSAGTVQIQGPHLEDAGDGGRDLIAIVEAPAHKAAFYPVLADHESTTIFSCKSHKDDASGKPRGWRGQVRDDIDPDPRIYDARSKRLADDAERRAQQTSEPLKALLDQLRDGVEYCILVNVGEVDLVGLAREFALRLRERAKLLFGSDADIRDDQVRVLSANEIVDAFDERPFTIKPDLEAKLGGSDDDFHSWSAWTERVEDERRSMSFVADPPRADLHARLEALIQQSSPGSLWVTGAPGVGKTRTVHQFFEQHPDLQAQLRQTDDWETLERWLRGDGPRSMTDVLLVADEVPSRQGDALAREFRRAARGTTAKLVMIGTQGDGQGSTSPRFPLERLEPREFRKIIDAELDRTQSQGTARERITEIVEFLSQGYPLFAMWLTQGLAENLELLDEPGTGLTDQQNPWTATKLVLASRSAHPSPADWTATADRRGRSLLLAMLEPSADWSFSPEEESALADALHVPWPELDRAATECRERGILRRTRRGERYISPANLERLILNYYFGGSDPPLKPRRLRDRLGARVDRLLVRAQRVQASDSCRRSLASGLLDATLERLREGEPGYGMLLWIAREIPTDVARMGHALIAADSSHLAPVAEDLRTAFGHLRHRALDRATFSLVEDALFVLGPSEEWSSIFASGFHATYQSFDVRLDLLESRLHSKDPSCRLGALAGLRTAIEPRGGPAINVGLDDIDNSTAGSWETPSLDESIQRAAKAWDLLIRATDDDDPEISDRARRDVAKGLRRGLAYGLRGRPELLGTLADRVPRWSLPQRNTLGAALDVVEHHDTESLREAPPELTNALDALKAVLRPHSLEERLMARVGRWHPSPRPIGDPERLLDEAELDRALAQECIEASETLLQCQDWLDSAEAVRVPAFGRALGEVDEHLVLLEPLRKCVEAGALQLLTASYLAAWADRAPEDFDTWIEQHAPRPALGNAIAMAIAGTNASAHRVHVLAGLVERGSVHPTSLRGIGSWGWAEGVPAMALDHLITALADTHDEIMARPAVGLAEQRLKGSTLDSSITDVLVRLVDQTRSIHLPATGEQQWADLVVALVGEGRSNVLESIVAAIVDIGYSHQAERALEALLRSGHVEALWATFAAKLVEDPIFVIPLEHMTSRTSFRERLSIDSVMEWVGHDPGRGATAAQLASPHAATLDPLAYALIERFGADSDPARELDARVGSTPDAVDSLARFYEQQADNAAAWAQRYGGEIARWAARLAASFRERAAAEREEDELMRQHG